MTVLFQSYCAELEQTVALQMILKSSNLDKLAADAVNYPTQALHVYRLNADVDTRNTLMLNNLAPQSAQYTIKAHIEKYADICLNATPIPGMRLTHRRVAKYCMPVILAVFYYL